MKLEFIEINKLKESPYNPRIHPEKALERLEKSIDKFGFTNPIMVQKSTKQIIAGHARLKAAKEAGLKKVPVIFLDFDDVTAKAYNIADNRLAELTEWDYPKLKDLITDIDTGAIDVELTGFDAEELKEIFDYDSPHQKQVGTRSKDDEFLILSFVVSKEEKDKIEKKLKLISKKNSFNDNSNTQALLWLLEKQN